MVGQVLLVYTCPGCHACYTDIHLFTVHRATCSPPLHWVPQPRPRAAPIAEGSCWYGCGFIASDQAVAAVHLAACWVKYRVAPRITIAAHDPAIATNYRRSDPIAPLGVGVSLVRREDGRRPVATGFIRAIRGRRLLRDQVLLWRRDIAEGLVGLADPHWVDIEDATKSGLGFEIEAYVAAVRGQTAYQKRSLDTDLNDSGECCCFGCVGE